MHSEKPYYLKLRVFITCWLKVKSFFLLIVHYDFAKLIIIIMLKLAGL